MSARRRRTAIGIALATSTAIGSARPARAQASPTSVTVDSMPAAQAPPPEPGLPVGFGADEVQLDARSQALDAVGHVRVDEPPFHLTSDALELRRVPIGMLLEGAGKVTFCPCLGAPLAVRFTGATVAPPHDLILRSPVLEVFGVPVAWAPAFWLRSPGRFGLLTPDIEWRGGDGFFAGGGVHVPWAQGDLVRGLDLRAGGYVDGGVAVDVAMRTTSTETHVRWDRLHGDDGVALAAHGSTAITAHEDPANTLRTDSVAWDVDALRGARAVQSTTEVDAAARPFDRATVQVAWLPDGWVLASGVRTVALRGGDVLDGGVGGPIVALRRADALGRAGTYDATFEGGQVAGGGLGATSFARAEGGALLATRLGPLGASVAFRGLGDLADDGLRSGVDGMAQARASLTLPLERDVASADPDDPWVHRTEPRVEAAVVAAHADDVLVVPAGRGLLDAFGAGEAWITAVGWSNAFGRAGSRAAVEVDAVAGTVGDQDGVRPLLRGTATAGGPWASMRADFARVVAVTSLDAAGAAGGAFLATVRLGPTSGFHVTAHAAERDGVDPLVARVLVDAPFEPSSGFLTTPGWTGGGRIGVPLGSRITTRGGADVDLGTRELVAAIGSLELHDPCGCVVLRATAAHRIGRDGVDAWVSVDLPMPR